MIRRMLKVLFMSVVVMISFFVIDVNARSLGCTYDITYTGYNNSEEKIQLTVGNNGDTLTENWTSISAGSNSPINNINNKSNYTNRLILNDFKDGENFTCPKISYTISKDNNNGYRVYVGNNNAGYLNSVSASSNTSNNDPDNSQNNTSGNVDNSTNNDSNNNGNSGSTNNSNSTDPTASPSPSASSELEKLEWEKLGEEDVDATCEDTMGDLIEELQKYFDMIKIIAPILLIVFGALDFAGATTGMNNKDTMQKTTSKFIRRCIAALAIFFLPTFIEVLLNLPGLPDIEDVLCGLK